MESSEPLPATPHRGRRRYPDSLAKEGHVPLHRRGKSKTYERLEDLLREAGYKECRVFTPESEQLDALRERSQREKERGPSGVNAVVNFFSAFISKHTESDSDNGSETVIRLDDESSSPSSSSPMERPSHDGFSSSSSASLSASLTSLGTMSTSQSLHLPVPQTQQAALRHMVSAPNIPSRQHSRSRQAQAKHESTQPPLPSNWLQMVTNALVRTHSETQMDTRDDVSTTRGRSQHTRAPPTHALMERTNRGRPSAARTVSGVTPTSVLCRSAPGSRATSRIRDHKPADRHQHSKSSDGGRLPSLGATVANDPKWDMTRLHPPVPSAKSSPKMPSNLHLSVKAPSENDLSYDDSDSDSDVGELDLARILVPAKRQKSIRSLSTLR